MTERQLPEAPPGPLYVDLDGSLVATDTLWESLCLLVRRRPGDALAAPLWLRGGKAHFKAQIAARVTPDAELLPYRPEVLAYLDVQREAGRKLVLATASHARTARAVAAHLGIFDDVLASDEHANLAGPEKLRAIEKHSEGRAFAYLGNSGADLAVWAHAGEAILVAPSREAREGVRRLDVPSETLVTQAPPLVPGIRALRPHQWVKNALLFAPIALAHQLGDGAKLSAVALAFAAFCAVASMGYLVNDLLDIEADRRHPSKRTRPFAAGTLSVPHGLVAVGGLLAFGFGIAAIALPWAFTGMLAIYLTLTLSYSFYFKERLFLDVLTLAGTYTHRVLTGGVAAQLEVSAWLLAFSVFFFLSLALVKRYVELLASAASAPAGVAGSLGSSGDTGVGDGGEETLSRRAYQVGDTALVETMGVASGYLSVLVLGLYVSSEDVTRFYSSPTLLWLISPLMLYWISRVWFLARRGSLPHDPVLFAATDRISYATGALIAAIGVAAAVVGP